MKARLTNPTDPPRSSVLAVLAFADDYAALVVLVLPFRSSYMLPLRLGGSHCCCLQLLHLRSSRVRAVKVVGQMNLSEVVRQAVGLSGNGSVIGVGFVEMNFGYGCHLLSRMGLSLLLWSM